MISSLAQKRQEDPANYSQVALMIDATAIRKMIQYDAKSKRMVGYVDLGYDESEETVAKEALVIMIVGLGVVKYKAPISSF